MDAVLLEPQQTMRLTLRRFAAGDFPAFAAYRRRPDIYRYINGGHPRSKELEDRFARICSEPFDKDGDMLRFAVIREEDAALVGDVVLKLADKASLQAELGYVFNPDYAGNGYATEAAAKMIDIGFAMLGFHRIFARLDTLNAGSIGVVERLGLRREAHFRENDHLDGVWRDEYVYAVLASEWRERADASRPIGVA